MALPYIAREALNHFYDVRVNRINTVDQSFSIPDQFFGVEIEVENLPREFTASNIPGWTMTSDGSLRGSGSREYIFDGPQSPGQMVRSINAFYDRADRNGLADRNVSSFRTSIHVHMDFTRNTAYECGLPMDTMHGAQVTGLLYYGMEDLFYRVADSFAGGFERRKSGYSFDIDAVPVDFVNWMVNPSSGPPEAGRYYGMNWNSLAKYGTIECRHLPLVLDRTVVFNWIETLSRLKRFAYERLRMDVEPSGVDVLTNPSIIDEAVPYVFARFPSVISHYNPQATATRVEKMATMITAASESPSQVRRYTSQAAPIRRDDREVTLAQSPVQPRRTVTAPSSVITSRSPVDWFTMAATEQQARINEQVRQLQERTVRPIADFDGP